MECITTYASWVDLNVSKPSKVGLNLVHWSNETVSSHCQILQALAQVWRCQPRMFKCGGLQACLPGSGVASNSGKVVSFMFGIVASSMFVLV